MGIFRKSVLDISPRLPTDSANYEVLAAGAGDIALRGPQGDQEKQDARSAHRYRGGRGEDEERGEHGCVHVDAR